MSLPSSPCGNEIESVLSETSRARGHLKHVLVCRRGSDSHAIIAYRGTPVRHD